MISWDCYVCGRCGDHLRVSLSYSIFTCSGTERGDGRFSNQMFKVCVGKPSELLCCVALTSETEAMSLCVVFPQCQSSECSLSLRYGRRVLDLSSLIQEDRSAVDDRENSDAVIEDNKSNE